MTGFFAMVRGSILRTAAGSSVYSWLGSRIVIVVPLLVDPALALEYK